MNRKYTSVTIVPEDVGKLKHLQNKYSMDNMSGKKIPISRILIASALYVEKLIDLGDLKIERSVNEIKIKN